MHLALQRRTPTHESPAARRVGRTETHKDSFSSKMDPFPISPASSPSSPHPAYTPSFDGFAPAGAGSCASDSSGGKSLLPSVINPQPRPALPGTPRGVLLVPFLQEPILPLCAERRRWGAAPFMPKWSRRTDFNSSQSLCNTRSGQETGFLLHAPSSRKASCLPMPGRPRNLFSCPQRCAWMSSAPGAAPFPH